MYTARDTRTGRVVAAGDASPYGDYICPMCTMPVFLRRGDVRVAHFAHRSGLASPECELYVPSDDIANPLTLPPGSHPKGQGLSSEKIAPLALSIAIEPEYRPGRRGARQWDLCVTIPKSTDQHGQIEFDSGGGVHRRIPLSTLVLRPLSHPVDLDAINYGAVWVSPEVSQPYRTAVTHRLPGLSKDRITAFATTPEKFKPRVEILSWATSYYFVWRASAGLALPEELPCHILAQRGPWHCALVSLTDEDEPGLLEWLRRATSLDVIPEKRRWSILYPPAHDIDIAGRIQLGPSNELFLGVFPAAEGAEPSSLECTVRGQRAIAATHGKGWRFVEINRWDSRVPVSLSLAWDHHALPELMMAPFADAIRPSVVIEFRSLRMAAFQAALHEPSCRSALDSVCASDFEITAVTFPGGVQGELRWRPAGEFESHVLALPHSMPITSSRIDKRLRAELVAAINLRLKDRGSEVWIDFGPFGSFHSNAREKATETTAQFTLRPSTRQQLIWFCKTSGAYQTSNGRPLDKLSDLDLVEHFAATPATPHLTGHRRAIEGDIKRGLS